MPKIDLKHVGHRKVASVSGHDMLAGSAPKFSFFSLARFIELSDWINQEGLPSWSDAFHETLGRGASAIIACHGFIDSYINEHVTTQLRYLRRTGLEMPTANYANVYRASLSSDGTKLREYTDFLRDVCSILSPGVPANLIFDDLKRRAGLVTDLRNIIYHSEGGYYPSGKMPVAVKKYINELEKRNKFSMEYGWASCIGTRTSVDFLQTLLVDFVNTCNQVNLSYEPSQNVSEVSEKFHSGFEPFQIVSNDAALRHITMEFSALGEVLVRLQVSPKRTRSVFAAVAATGRRITGQIRGCPSSGKITVARRMLTRKEQEGWPWYHVTPKSDLVSIGVLQD